MIVDKSLKKIQWNVENSYDYDQTFKNYSNFAVK